MTRIDFYILKQGNAGKLALFTCRLTEKIFSKGHRIYIHTDSDRELQQLDDLLWTYQENSFLPHGICGEETTARQPIVLGCNMEPEGQSDVLLNLAGEVAPFFSRFSRVAELVAGNDAKRSAARERYRYYKDRGYSLHTHDITL